MPGLVEVLAPVVEKTRDADARILLAMLERIAGENYRVWAEQTKDPAERGGLLRCAEREEQIAKTLEQLDANADTKADRIRAQFPNLAETYRSAFSSRSRAEQLAIQAEGELGGRDFLQSFAKRERDPRSAALFRELATIEVENAEFLQGLV